MCHWPRYNSYLPVCWLPSLTKSILGGVRSMVVSSEYANEVKPAAFVAITVTVTFDPCTKLTLALIANVLVPTDLKFCSWVPPLTYPIVTRCSCYKNKITQIVINWFLWHTYHPSIHLFLTGCLFVYYIKTYQWQIKLL